MNRSSYNRIATQWDAARHAFHGREASYLDTLLQGLPPGATVLDVGCGTGRPMAEAIIERGLRVIGIDQADQMLSLARTRFPDQQWVQAAIETHPFAERHDAALIWDALFHIDRTHHAAILGRVVAGLPMGGRLMLTVGGSAHPAFTDEMFGQPFFYDSHTPEQTRAILEGLGCRVVWAEFMNLPDGGRDKGRYALMVTREGAVPG